MLARALYKQALVVILDEPTAALNPIAENCLQESYNEIKKNKTAVFISHRLASARCCNRILLKMERSWKKAPMNSFLAKEAYIASCLKHK